MTIWLLPIESQSMRYSDQWLKWFTERLVAHNINHQIIFGTKFPENKDIGAVFDSISTNLWKLSQMYNLVRAMQDHLIKDGDIIFDFDLWHPGLESLAYIKAMKNLDVKLYGILHAGTYDKSDFTYLHGMEWFGKHLEQAWIQMARKIFVGSNYHKKMLGFSRKAHNVVVTGMPFNSREIRSMVTYKGSKENLVVWTSRVAPEKRPDWFDAIEKSVKKIRPDVQFIATHRADLSKQNYYNLLSRASIVLSTALQETFGIGTVEAMTLGCTPVVPNGLSYVDYTPRDCRYYTIEQAKNLILKFLEEPADYSNLVAKYDGSIDNMLDEMNLI